MIRRIEDLAPGVEVRPGTDFPRRQRRRVVDGGMNDRPHPGADPWVSKKLAARAGRIDLSHHVSAIPAGR